MASFWDSDSSSGWSDDPTTRTPVAPVAQAAATPPTQQQMVDAWNANRQDPAKIHDLMQTSGVTLDEAAKLLGVNQSAMADYLNSGRKQVGTTGGSTGGWDAAPIGDPTYNYDRVVATPSQSLDQFLADNKDKIDPTTGKFYGPDKGVNYSLEGANAKDFYTQNIGQHLGGYTGGGDGMEWDPNKEMGFTDNLNSRTGWVEGPDNGGGFIGGLGRNFDKMIHDPHAWAVIAMALTAGAINPGEVAAAEGVAGAETAGTAATAGGAGVGGSAGIGSGTVLGGGTAVAPTASGLAGTLGMSPGLAANALNSGALSTGVNLAQGHNLGDSVKSGLVSAALSPVGTMASGATASALGSSVSPTVANVAGSVVGSAAQGGARAALTGQNVGDGIIHGARNGVVDAAGNIVGGTVQSATGSNLAGNAASALTHSTLTGSSPLEALTAVGVGAAANQIVGSIPGFSTLSPTQQSMIRGLVTSTLSGKNPTQALINQVTSLASNRVAIARPATRSIKTGGWAA